MESSNFVARVRLARAMVIYFRLKHPELQISTADLVDTMRPRKLNWASEPRTDPTSSRVNDNNSFAKWSVRDTKFYLVVDFHVAASNLIMNHLDLDLDFKDMFMAACVMFYSDLVEAKNKVDEITVTPAETGGQDLPDLNNAEINTVTFALDHEMDPIVAAAVAEYQFLQLDYLQLPIIEDTDRQFGAASSGNDTDNVDENNSPGSADNNDHMDNESRNNDGKK